MKEQAAALQEVIDRYSKLFQGIGDATAGIVLAQDKWSLKQILGHLIDSASNNHQRILRLKQDSELHFPDYEAFSWLDASDYNSFTFSHLTQMFVLYNRHLAQLIVGLPENVLSNQWIVTWGDVGSINLKDLVIHYVDHLETHYTHFRERLDELIAGSI